MPLYEVKDAIGARCFAKSPIFGFFMVFFVLGAIHKGPSINDITPKGEGGEYLKKGRDSIFSRGDTPQRSKIALSKSHCSDF